MMPDAESGEPYGSPEMVEVVQKDAAREAPGAGSGARSAAKPRGRKISVRIDDLPPVGATRWVIRRKAQVVAAVQAGIISLEEVCERYTLSVEEFQSWQRSLEGHGLYGLRTTRLQIYRSK
jgi:hypothetical protein